MISTLHTDPTLTKASTSFQDLTLTRKSKDAINVVHWSKKKLEDMTEKDWKALREDYSISTRSKDAPNPLRNWEESSLPKLLLDCLREYGFHSPTPIQRATIPIGMQSRDVLGIAQTGSGKTLSFLLPMFHFLNQLPRINADTAQDGPYAIVLAPTRVLVEQIQEEASKFGKCLNIRSVAIVGGRSVEQQAFALGKGVELVCATPDRLFDLLDRRLLVLSQCNYIVLDEADRMLDLGFEPKIAQVMRSLPSSNTMSVAVEAMNNQSMYRHTVMFSATMPPAVEELAKQYLRDPVRIEINVTGTRVADSVEQRFEWVTPNEKMRILVQYLRDYSGPIIIFCNKKVDVDKLASAIESTSSLRKLHRVTTYHASKTQDQRDLALEGFRTGRYTILIATDVAARGVDVKGITLVVNYMMPDGEHPIQTYTHRIGRTGRAGMKGTALSFITDEDIGIYYHLRRFLEESGIKVPKQIADHPASKIDPKLLQKGTDLRLLTRENF